MAIGLGRMFGIRLPMNFNSPYKADSIIEFWRRWHMTLSRFLRDYLYLPLGGNQRGSVRRYTNLMIVMLLGGLWHRANWTFAIWVGIHGLLLMINHAWRKLPFAGHALYLSMPVRLISIGVTFICVALAWIPFRAETIGQARTLFSYLIPYHAGTKHAFVSFLKAQFKHWFKPHELWPPTLAPDYLATMAQPVGIILLVILIATFLIPNTSQYFAKFEPVINHHSNAVAKGIVLNRLNMNVAGVVSLMFVISVLQLSHVSPFLYFQF
jgi:alginate O-acetyltransferase complex protein AlgI